MARRSLKQVIYAAEFDGEFLIWAFRDSLLVAFIEVANWFWRRRTSYSHTKGGVLFAGFAHRSGILALRPLIECLKKNGQTGQVLKHDDFLARHHSVFRKNRISSIPIEVFLSLKDYLKSFFGNHPELSDLSPRRRCWAHRHGLAVDRAINILRPDLVVIPDERQPVARQALLAAQRHGIRTLSLPEVTDQFKWSDFGKRSAHSTWVFCRELEAQLIANGSPGVRLSFSENSIPSVVENVMETTKCLKRQLGWPLTSPTILFAAQALLNNEAIFSGLRTLERALPQFHWAYRAHPNQTTWLLRVLLQSKNVGKSLATAQAVRASDLVITHSSQVALTAIFSQKPVILWNPEGTCPAPVLLQRGCVRFASSLSELKAEILSHTTNPHQLLQAQLDWVNSLPIQSEESRARILEEMLVENSRVAESAALRIGSKKGHFLEAANRCKFNYGQ